jgi:hypothetical protein
MPAFCASETKVDQSTLVFVSHGTAGLARGSLVRRQLSTSAREGPSRVLWSRLFITVNYATRLRLTVTASETVWVLGPYTLFDEAARALVHNSSDVEERGLTR